MVVTKSLQKYKKLAQADQKENPFFLMLFIWTCGTVLLIIL